MIPIRYNVRSLIVRRTTTFATAGGIALVVFVLSSSLMLAAGIKKTLSAGGRADNAIVLRLGSDAELGSVIEESSIPLILAAPGVKQDEHGQPLGSGEIVVVAAMEKLGRTG
jgi:putative ABC transport system permease protein